MAANCVKTIRYFFTTRTTDLATNTTLGTATRHDFSAITLDIPENTSRTFQSVILKISYRDHFTVANEVTGVRMGIKLGATAFADTDRSFTQANTGDHLYDEWWLDCTSYFNTNFGSGTSQTCQAGIAVSSTTASNIGGNIAAELIITYSFDDTVGTTRVKTIGIPIGSHASALTTTQAEIGSDGTNPPPSGQIPALATFLKEASVSIKGAAIVLEASDGHTTGTTDLAPEVQIDATTAVARGAVGQALSTIMVYRDVFNYDTTTFSTGSAHQLKMRDTTTTARFPSIGAVLWVTYTYNKSTTTRMLNQVMVPFTQSENDGGWDPNGQSMTTSLSDAQIMYATFDIQEPGTITLEQSAAILRNNVISNGGTMGVFANTQTARVYSPAAGSGEWLVHHRGDYGSGAWTLSRGINTLKLGVYNPALLGRTATVHAYALITYSSDVPAGGTEVGNRVIATFNSAYGTTPATIVDIAASGAGQIAPSFLGSGWKLNGAMFSGRARSAASNTWIFQYQHASGEFAGDGFTTSTFQRGWTVAELYSWGFDHAYTRSFNPHFLQAGKMAPQAAHRLLAMSTSALLLNSAMYWSIHSLTFTLAGTLTIDGVTASDGETIEIWAYTSTTPIEVERVTTTTTSGGAGGFTCVVPDNTRTYFATHTDGADFGKSKSATPDSSFNITVRGSGGGGDITDPTILTISQPVLSTDPLIVSVGDLSGLAMYEVTCRDRADGARLVVYSPLDGAGNAGFLYPFAGRSTVTGSGTIASPYIFTIYRQGRWPTGISLDVRVQAVDTKGNEVNA